MELAIEVEAEDVSHEDSKNIEPLTNDVEHDQTSTNSGNETCFQFLCEARDLRKVSDAIKKRSFTISSASLDYFPMSQVGLFQKDYERAVKVVNLLLERDDVMEVYDNFILEKEKEWNISV